MGIYRAVLDADGVLRGYEAVDAIGEGEVPAGDCDLEIGQYRWNGQTFLPLKSPEPEDLVAEPDTLAAIALGFDAIERSGLVKLPDRTARWLKWYRKTVDAKGLFSREGGNGNGDA